MYFKDFALEIFSKFEATTKHFSPINAACLAVCADLVYSEWVIVEKVVQKLGFDYFKYADILGTQSFVIADDKKIIVAFRGTEGGEFKDISTDLNTSLVPYHLPNPDKYYSLIDEYEEKKLEGKFGNVHEGFKNALDLIWGIVFNQLRECKKEDIEKQRYRPIWICGHSLGGALANLATARLWEHEYDEIHGVYTFGQPRVGDKEFAEWFNFIEAGTYFRFVNNNDVVARVPFYNGYQHVNKMMYFDADGDLQKKELSSSSMLWDRLKSSFVTDFGSDHLMKYYIELTARHAGYKDLL